MSDRRHPRRLATAVRWPVGIVWTGWSYLWRTTPFNRTEQPGRLPDDAPPPLPAHIPADGIQRPEDGHGALLRRRYRIDVDDARCNAGELIAELRDDPDVVVPWGLARFHKVHGEQDAPLVIGDEFLVRMPGPWDGPVRVVDATATSFRFATLDGHLEAGQIEWRARDLEDGLRFEVESWSRPGDRVSAWAHHRVRMAKEVQLHMWTSVLENVASHCDGRRRDGITITTRIVEDE